MRNLLLVTVKGNTSLTAIDLASGSVVAQAPTGWKPHEIALTRDGAKAFVSIYGSADYGRNEPGNEISVIDLNSFEEIDRMNLGLYRAPHGMITDRDGFIWVTVEENHSVLVIDPDSHRIEQTVWMQMPVHFATGSRDGRRLYFTHKEYPFVTIVDQAARDIEKRIRLPRGGQALRQSADGALLYVGDFDTPLMHVIDCACDQVVRTVGLRAVPGWPYPTPDGRHVAVTTLDEPAGDGFVEIFDAASLEKTGEVHVKAEPFHAISDPDGRHLHVALSDGRLGKVDIAAARMVGEIRLPGDMPETLAII